MQDVQLSTTIEKLYSLIHMKLQQTHTHQVCAVGSLPWAGEEVIWKWGESSLNPPGGSWEQPVTNWSSLAISSCVKLLTIVQNHDTTSWNRMLLPLIFACPLRSSKLTVPMPHIRSCVCVCIRVSAS